MTIDADAANTVDKGFVLGRVPAASVALSGVAPASALFGNHFYSGGAPGLAFALFPAYVVLHPAFPDEVAPDGRGREPSTTLVWLLDLLGAALPLALGAVAVRRAASALGATEPIATASAAVHALATIALPFGTRLYAHSLVVALLAWSLAALLGGASRKERPAAALAGFLVACAVACDYSAALPGAVLFALALSRAGSAGALAFVAGAVPPALGLAAYHWACFGSPFATAYDYRLDAATRALLAHGAYGFTAPRLSILAELLVGPRRGMLWTEPAALLGLVGLGASVRASRTHALAFAGAAVVILANAARTHDWSAGSSFGPRYAIAALPFLALGYPRAFELAGRAARPIVVASAFVEVAGAATDWTFSVPGTLEQLHVSGLHAGRTIPLALACLAAVALARPRAGALAWIAAGLLPLALDAPWRAARFLEGPAAVERARHACERREVERAIASTRDADEARARAAIVRRVAETWDDPALYVAALERVLELDPSDAVTRERCERIRAELHR